ncbi:MFS transporter [Leucobacter sp. W1478]|uniref:MFS transporter n=1 Tax=Leucobacter sp. W1478 TaxID=3439065 RepID=UPI003F3129FF
MTAMFRSFASFNYRVWFIGALVSNIGTWMQATALNWVVLTEVTNYDATAVGITMALQFAPPLLLVPVTGWVTDRFDRRHVLYVTQTAFTVLAVLLGLLLLSGQAQLWHLYLLAALFGVVMAFDNPARQTIVTDIVSLQNASNAVALNSAAFNVARLIGPAVAGFTIVAVGSGWVFLVNAATFLIMLVMIKMLQVDQLPTHVRSTQKRSLLEGFRYVSKRRDLLVVFGIVFLMGAFGMNFPIIASTMAVEFGKDADGFGLLSSILAIGSLTGALLAARRERARISVVIGASGFFAVASIVSAFMPSYWLYAASLMLTGFAVVTLLTTANAVVQTTTDPALRGRVMAIYMAILMGGTPIGAPIIGWVADAMGPRWAIGVGAIAALVGCIGGLVWLVTSGRIHRGESMWRLTLDRTQSISVVHPEQFSDEIASTTPISLSAEETKSENKQSKKDERG